METFCVWEHNGDDTLLYSVEFPGAYTRGASFQEAADKMPSEILSFCRWAGFPVPESISIRVIQESSCQLAVADADSDVIFDSEKQPLTLDEYHEWKALALKSARDFQALYESIPDAKMPISPSRCTFYGTVPSSAEEMYNHTKNVNSYYFGEIGVDVDNEGDIYICRLRGFEKLESMDGFPDNRILEGSYGEQWSLRKMLRRFLWHDRIHAKAMYRRSCSVFPDLGIPNVFLFNYPRFP